MATTAAIRTALKTALQTISGLTVYDYRPGTISPPAAILTTSTVTYDVDFSGDDDHTMAVQVFVSFANDRNAEDALDLFRDGSGSSSIAAAIHSDPTLGGVVSYARVTQSLDNGLVPVGGVEYLAATFTVEIGN